MREIVAIEIAFFDKFLSPFFHELRRIILPMRHSLKMMRISRFI